MDFDKIKKIKLYSDQIKQFRKLNKYKNMNNSLFYNEMKTLFPAFEKENKIVFRTIIDNENLEFLDLMFQKLNYIENEYVRRKNEVKEIVPIINDIKNLIKVNDNVDKSKIILHLEKNNSNFVEKYPVIIDRLLDKETRHLNAEQLFLDQIKYKYEIQIGNVLAEKYVYPNI